MGSLRTVARRTARRSERIQDAYEAMKNRARRPVLRELIPAGGVGAELGVHKGHLTPVLFEIARPSHLYAVDPWYKLEPRWEWAAGDKSTVNAFARVAKRLRKFLELGVLTLVVDDDRKFLEGLEDGHLDWVYLDSSHDYGHTMEELALLVDKVSPGGMIVGDDWQEDPGHRHHGVCKAVREFESNGRIRVIYASQSDHQWAAAVVG